MKAAAVASVQRVGSLRLEIRKFSDGRFGFDYTPPGEMRVKVRLRELDTAEIRAREILGAANGGKVERLSIDESEYVDFLRWKSERGTGAKSQAIVESFLLARKNKGLSIPYFNKLRANLDHFAAAFPGSLDAISRAEFERWLDSHDFGNRAWNNLRSYVVTLCRFARREGILGAPLSGPEMSTTRRVSLTVSTYTPAELRKILAVVENEWLPFVALSAFCGLRPAEIAPQTFQGKPGLRWENILWTKRKIDVPAETAKTRRRRFVELNDAAAAFLEPWKNAHGPIAPASQVNKQTKRWGEESGVGWKPNALRHSFASYRLALTQNTAALALEMGNSPAMIFAHYLDLKHAPEAEEWFAIRPSSKSSMPPRPQSQRRAPRAARLVPQASHSPAR